MLEPQVAVTPVIVSSTGGDQSHYFAFEAFTQEEALREVPATFVPWPML